MSEIVQLSTFLKSKGLSIPAENVWLKSCVSCYKSMTPSYSQSDLNQFVFTQWRLADLRSVGAPTLPSDCIDKEYMILNGKFAVQLNYGVNVAIPFHKQLLKIRKPESQFNLEVDAAKEKSNTKEFRSLKIEITDGLTTIIGFEDKPINCIDVVLPGEKALLIGPIEIRRGCLMLTDKNISLLGGEVDTLFVPNAVENVLARALNLHQNPNPIDSSTPETSQVQLTLDDGEDDLFMAAALLESQNITQTTATQSNSFQNQNTSQRTQNFTQNSSTNQTLSKKTAPTQKPNTQKTLNSFITISPKPNSIQKPVEANPMVEKNLKNMFDDDFDFPLEENMLAKSQPKETLDPLVLKREMEKSYMNDNWNRQPAAQAPPPSHEKGKIVIEYLGSPLSQLAETEPATQRMKPIINPLIDEPFPPKTYPSERRLKGRVVRLTQKLGLKDEEWKLSAIIAVKGMELDMDFAPQVLDKIIGINGKDLTSKKKEVVRNPEIKSQMNKILIDGQHKIKSLNCDMLIKFNNFIANPVISDVFEET